MTSQPTNFEELVDIFLDLIYTAYPVVVALSFVAFFWGLAKFIFRAGDEKAVKDGKKLMIWGLIALFIIMSLNAILSFAFTDIGFKGEFGIPLLPK